MKKAVFLILISIVLIQAQTTEEIISKVKKKYSEVNDYQADVKINIDLNYIKLKNNKGKVYFKKPDKFKFLAEGFGILPKQAGNINPELLFQKDFTILKQKEDTLHNSNNFVLRIIPMSDSSDVILSTVWIDQEKFIIRKIESNSKSAGNVEIEIFYESKINFALPIKIQIKLNGGMTEKNKENKQSSKNLFGDVSITYSNYLINKGIDDKIFLEK